MNITAEGAVVALIVILAASYLVRRRLQERKRKADNSACGGNCRCSQSKPAFLKKP
ncbi:FeoB-associated Cys-rich membrane protein [Pelagicoccus albus]|uniref:FeoB-associated Cys-rich membrane protein n=1 Tax=Pelagicoccus albus TaxID=415222 RepID=A0A7X1E8N9_9BACT|nr:FeoB-associated Cys-rich membrane protein [Pelagicoccus albus]